jgi:periplasmic divalent cation tolerance protein
MSDVLVILCTFPDSGQARQIGTRLVEMQLAACVNIIPAVESIYRWQGKVETDAEVLAIFKTSAAAFADIERTLTELHPYEVPEIISMAPEKIAESYPRWVCVESIPRSRSGHAD